LADEKIQELGRKSAGLDTTRKAVLTAVNIMHEKVLLEEENRRLTQELNRLKYDEQ
ncbi:cell division protein ZapA, partial [Staphylococcus nepalensis]